MREIRDGGSAIAGGILSSVVVSRVGMGGGEPLISSRRGTLGTEGQAGRGWEPLRVGNAPQIRSARALASLAPAIWITNPLQPPGQG